MTLFLFLQVLTLKAFAEINLLDGSYTTTTTDFEIRQDRRNIKLRRFYNSRSLHDGLFGFGWCSDLEKKLDLRRSGQITLIDCRLRTSVIFKKKTSSVYTNEENPSDQLLLEPGGFRRTTAQAVQSFTTDGRLQSLADHSGFELRLFYDYAGDLQKVQVNGESTLRFKLDPGRRRILSILSPVGTTTYLYEKNLLTTVTPPDNEASNYRYDTLKNLVQVKRKSLQEWIKYDERNDRAIHLQHQNGCKEQVQYLGQMQSLKNTSISEIKCPQRPPLKTAYQFTFRKDSQGNTQLEKVTRLQKTSNNERISFVLQGGSY